MICLSTLSSRFVESGPATSRRMAVHSRYVSTRPLVNAGSFRMVLNVTWSHDQVTATIDDPLIRHTLSKPSRTTSNLEELILAKDTRTLLYTRTINYPDPILEQDGFRQLRSCFVDARTHHLS
jgi:hypothetical protein